MTYHKMKTNKMKFKKVMEKFLNFIKKKSLTNFSISYHIIYPLIMVFFIPIIIPIKNFNIDWDNMWYNDRILYNDFMIYFGIASYILVLFIIVKNFVDYWLTKIIQSTLFKIILAKFVIKWSIIFIFLYYFEIIPLIILQIIISCLFMIISLFCVYLYEDFQGFKELLLKSYLTIKHLAQFYLELLKIFKKK